MDNKRKYKILLISPLLPGIGGISISVEKMRKRLVMDGHEVSTINLRFKDKKYNNKLFLFVRFALIPFMVLFKSRYDLIHCHATGGYRKYYLSFFKFLYKNASLIFTIHGDVSYMLDDNKSLYALNNADGVICVQKGDSNKLRPYLRHSVILSDIPAFFACSIDDTDTIPPKIQSFISLNSDPLIVVCGKIAISSTFYDLYGMLDAAILFSRLRNKGIAAKMLMIVIGDASKKEQIVLVDKIKDEVGEDKNFMMSESVKAMEPIFDNTQLYLRPTKTDGDSLSVREALMSGCQVLASDVSCRPSGTILYNSHSIDDMEQKAIGILNSHIEKNHQVVDFYNNLIDFYDQVIER
ncbi:MAG: glycosyltransferase family 4 protein [Muribaculaceae bacterium]|nr:glycosyltransferase family 4 protein [Muribaculaceae bacterium]